MTHPYDPREELDERDLDPPVDEGEKPVDLDVIERLLDELPPTMTLTSTKAELLAALPAMVRELRRLRERFDELEGLPTRREFAITDGPHPDQASVIWPGSAEDALRLAEDPARKGWVRKVMVHPWQSLNDSPF